MKKTLMGSVVFLMAFGTAISDQEKRPIGISPASEMGIAKVGTACPTFSWTSVDWARGYRIEVFSSVESWNRFTTEGAQAASPVLIREIQGAATSWTPTIDERLENGGSYIWFVQALDEFGQGVWSEGRGFVIQQDSGFAAIEDILTKAMEENGVDHEISEDVLERVKSSFPETEAPADSGALPINVTGNETGSNTWYGQDAGFKMDSGIEDSFFGYNAGYNTVNGGQNTFIGFKSGYSNNYYDDNTFVGWKAGYTNKADENTFIGSESGEDNLDGIRLTFIGFRSGKENSIGDDNTYVGYRAGRMGQGSDCQRNTIMGSLAGENNDGDNNAFLGYNAGHNNNSGAKNTFLGSHAGESNYGGDYNTFIGCSAGYSNTSNYNTYLGYRAGYESTGSGNVFLGHQAGFNEAGSNKLCVDNSDTSTPLIWGDFENDILSFMGVIGVGTKAPEYPMEMKKTGANASIVVDRTDGATNYINATDSYGNFGTVNGFPLRLVTNGQWHMRLNQDRSLTMRNGASCTTGGMWVNASSRDLKENIKDLTEEQALLALENLNPVTYNYKADKDESCVGFIAEDVPDLVSTKDRKGMAAMDVVAVLTRVVQGQQKMMQEQQRTIEELQINNENLRIEIEELKKHK